MDFNARVRLQRIRFENFLEEYDGELFDFLVSNPPYIPSKMLHALDDQVKYDFRRIPNIYNEWIYD